MRDESSVVSVSLTDSSVFGRGSPILRQEQLLRPEFTSRRMTQERPMSPIVTPRRQPTVLPSRQPSVSMPHSIPTAMKTIWPVPLKKSLTHKKQNLLVDAGLMMGRSFRVGWGPNWTLVHSGSEISERTDSSQNRMQTSFGILGGRQEPRKLKTTPYAVVTERIAFLREETSDLQVLWIVLVHI